MVSSTLVTAIGTYPLLIALLPVVIYTLNELKKEATMNLKVAVIISIALVSGTLSWILFAITRTQFAFFPEIYKNNEIGCKAQFITNQVLLWNAKITVFIYFSERFILLLDSTATLVQDRCCTFAKPALRGLAITVLLNINVALPIVFAMSPYDPKDSRGLCTITLLQIATFVLVICFILEMGMSIFLVVNFVRFLSTVFRNRMTGYQKNEIGLEVIEDPTISHSVRYTLLVSFTLFVTLITHVFHFGSGPRLVRYELDAYVNCIFMCLGLKYFNDIYMKICCCHTRLSFAFAQCVSKNVREADLEFSQTHTSRVLRMRSASQTGTTTATPTTTTTEDRLMSVTRTV